MCRPTELVQQLMHEEATRRRCHGARNRTGVEGFLRFRGPPSGVGKDAGRDRGRGQGVWWKAGRR